MRCSNTLSLFMLSCFSLDKFKALPESYFIFLPPASVGWGKVIFSVCVSVHTRGPPSADCGVPLSKVRTGRYTLPRSGLGVPLPRSGQGGSPIPGQDRGYPLPINHLEWPVSVEFSFTIFPIFSAIG